MYTEPMTLTGYIHVCYLMCAKDNIRHSGGGGDSYICYRDVWSQVSITYPLCCKLTLGKLTHIGDIPLGISATL